MTWRLFILAAASVEAGLLTGSRAAAQSTTLEIYTLIEGSQLTDECPMCGRSPIVVPMKGTFSLRLTNQNSLFSSYEMRDIAFQAGSSPGPQYQLNGGGTYRVGGEVAWLQQVFLSLEINNTAVTQALCANPDPTIIGKWPKLLVSVDQTNGTPGQVYHLTLVAIPAPKLATFGVDPQTGDVQLHWTANGSSNQVERASSIQGPYSAVTPITTNSSFVDRGALTNSAQYFYRLRQF